MDVCLRKRILSVADLNSIWRRVQSKTTSFSRCKRYFFFFLHLHRFTLLRNKIIRINTFDPYIHFQYSNCAQLWTIAKSYSLFIFYYILFTEWRIYTYASLLYSKPNQNQLQQTRTKRIYNSIQVSFVRTFHAFIFNASLEPSTNYSQRAH